MIRVSAFYSQQAAASFDFDYYKNQHFPMVLALMKPFGAIRFEVERGLAMSDGSAPAYLAVGTIYFETMDGLAKGLAQHGGTILADVKNYTNLTPRLQFGELV
ncbi:EthD family reductase [Permianibacter sp. IMCC34836]|uniref:EthD family reductase n=1 Tax=Permianibacter fluminis TaxID=2738515 RepID=UPI001552EB94|nr:EthD family reductase [Permianibacter fluminis]NQD35893.1 EthD family reductase [Permianibacter fluminis]